MTSDVGLVGNKREKGGWTAKINPCWTWNKTKATVSGCDWLVCRREAQHEDWCCCLWRFSCLTWNGKSGRRWFCVGDQRRVCSDVIGWGDVERRERRLNFVLNSQRPLFWASLLKKTRSTLFFDFCWKTATRLWSSTHSLCESRAFFFSIWNMKFQKAGKNHAAAGVYGAQRNELLFDYSVILFNNFYNFK